MKWQRENIVHSCIKWIGGDLETDYHKNHIKIRCQLYAAYSSLSLWNQGVDRLGGAETSLTDFLGEMRTRLRLMANGPHNDAADMKILSRE